MAEAYPWGAQSPQARLSKLQGSLTRNHEARERYMAGHKTKVAEFDDAERQLKADIRVCEGIIEKERTEAQSQQLSQLLARIAGKGAVDLGALLSDPNLEKKLIALAAEAEKPAEVKPSKAKKAAGASEGDSGGGEAGAPAALAA
jgi:hypothetical protein